MNFGLAASYRDKLLAFSKLTDMVDTTIKLWYVLLMWNYRMRTDVLLLTVKYKALFSRTVSAAC